MFIFEGREIKTDADGYLKNSHEWCESMVSLLAKQENIILTEQHWEIIRFIREFYLEFNTSPSIRMLVKAIARKYERILVIAAIFIAFFQKARRSKQQNLPVYLSQ